MRTEQDRVAGVGLRELFHDGFLHLLKVGHHLQKMGAVLAGLVVEVEG